MNKIESRFIIPNIVTGTNMFLGFISIIMAIKGDYVKAAIFILMAILTDGADGKIARILNGFSDFGKEFDSFSDAVSFGVAPSILIYSILNKNNIDFIEKTHISRDLVIPVSFLFLLCVILRLVKFNIMTVPSKEKADFIGMPSPTGAGIIASYIIFSTKIFGDIKYIENLFVLLVFISSLMMISTIKFKNVVKTFRVKNIWIIAVIVILLFSFFQYTLFPFGILYTLINVADCLKDKKIKIANEVDDIDTDESDNA